MKRLITRSALIAAVTLLAGPSYAATIDLVAKEFTATMPGGASVQMWGFGLDTGPASTASSPGPRITVSAGDPTLIINLRNELGVPVSLVIPSQVAPMSPTWVRANGTVYTGSRAAGDVTSRMRSVAAETAPGGSNTYTWTNLRPGTHILRSGTQPQVQVQMGLFAAVTKDADTDEAYPDVAYDNELTLFYSEVDPALHATVAAGCYGPGPSYPAGCGTTTPIMTSTLGYAPKYFLVNGGAGAISAAPIVAGERLLVRFLNSGLRSTLPMLEDLRMNLVAEDGFQYPHERDQYTVLLAAGQTKDAIIVSTSASPHGIIDRSLNLTDNGVPGGGAQVNLQISPAAGVPVAVNDSYSVNEEATLNGASVLDNDSGTGLSAVLASGVSVGNLNFNNNGTFTYQPPTDFFGQAIFTYRAEEAGTTSNLATVTISVNNVNDLPVAADDAYSAFQNLALSVPAATGVLLNDTDVDGDALTAVSLDTGGTTGLVSLNPDGSFTYVAGATVGGSDSFRYRANDGSGNSAQATVTIDITANAAPIASNDAVLTNNASSTTIAVLGNDNDPDGTLNPLTVTVVNIPVFGVTQINPDGTITYFPDAIFTGTQTFTYTVNDNLGLTSNEATVTVNIDAAPPGTTRPVAVADAYSVRECSTLTVAAPGVLGNDTNADGTPLVGGTAFSFYPATNGVRTLNANGSFTYTPNCLVRSDPSTHFRGTDSFSYLANDGTADSVPGNVVITVFPNRAPVASNFSIETLKNVLFSGTVLGNVSDPDNDPLTIQLVSGVLHGDLDLNANGTFTYDPTNGYDGPDSFSFTARDDLGATSNVATVSITVRNLPPVTQPDAYVLQRPDLRLFLIVANPGVLGNDSDPNGDPITASLNGGAGDGIVALSSAGGFTYTLIDPNFRGNDDFNYRAFDGTDFSGTETVSIRVNREPTANNITLDTPKNVPTSIPVSANDNDGAVVSAEIVSQPLGTAGTASVAGTTISFDPVDGFTGLATFTYRVFDNDGAPSNVATVTADVFNQAPIALGDAYGTAVGEILEVDAGAGVLSNDSDPDGDPMTAQLVRLPEKGTLVFSPDGSFTYTPTIIEKDNDTFTYRAFDGVLTSATVVVQINIADAAGTRPVANDDNASTAAGTPVRFSLIANDSDVDGDLDPDSIQIIKPPKNGGSVVVHNDGTGEITFTPGPSREDEFAYTVGDLAGNRSEEAGVHVNIGAAAPARRAAR